MKITNTLNEKQPDGGYAIIESTEDTNRAVVYVGGSSSKTFPSGRKGEFFSVTAFDKHVFINWIVSNKKGD